MGGKPTRDVLRRLRTLYECGVTGHLSDEQLLELFLAQRDQTAHDAFAAIVHRHGPMVRGVCFRILGNRHDADDAFQATFLVLARKAATVNRRERVANWLYGVAYRTAKEARSRAARRRAREERASMLAPSGADGDSAEELRRIIDEELARLPARYRAPIVLCELEGLSRRDAARQLGIPEGTLSSRLARAKSELRARLARHGLNVPAVALAAAIGRDATAAGLSDLLVESTASAAMRVAASSLASAVVSASVASLTEGVLKAMLLAKLKGIVLGTGTLALVITGAVALAQSGPKSQGLPPSEADRAAALEKKLDRILDALDRLARSAPAAPPIGYNPATQRQPGPAVPADTIAPPQVAGRQNPIGRPILPVDPTGSKNAAGLPGSAGGAVSFPNAIRDASARGTAGLLPTRDARTLSLADRVELVEEEVRNAVSRLEQMEKRLADLEQRVGATHNPRRTERQNPASPF
jgi:RNA polymerase sigma factor (sigma-70 family)